MSNIQIIQDKDTKDLSLLVLGATFDPKYQEIVNAADLGKSQRLMLITDELNKMLGTEGLCDTTIAKFSDRLGYLKKLMREI